MDLKNLLIGFLFLASVTQAAPKYAQDVHPVSSDHAYLMTHAAPDYWRLSPYYVPQINGAACSAASFAMIINGARSKLPLTSEDKLVTQMSLAEQLKDQLWGKAILQASKYTQGELIDLFKKGIVTRSPIKMKEYDSVLTPLMEKNGLKIIESKWLHVQDTSPKTRKLVRDLLIQNEKSDEDFIVLDMVQGDLTGDSDGMVAHVAVVGAFDEKSDRVLVMDPDRDWYEPYWTTLNRLLDSTVKLESQTDMHHGLFYIKVGAKK